MRWMFWRKKVEFSGPTITADKIACGEIDASRIKHDPRFPSHIPMFVVGPPESNQEGGIESGTTRTNG